MVDMDDKELEQKATTYSTNVVTNMKIAQLLSEAYKSGFHDAKETTFPEIKKGAEAIAKAFNKHRGTVKACKDDALYGRLYVMNEGVLLRRVLEELGYSDNEIEEVIHKG